MFGNKMTPEMKQSSPGATCGGLGEVMALIVLLSPIYAAIVLVAQHKWDWALNLLIPLPITIAVLVPLAFTLSTIAVIKAKALKPYRLVFLLSSLELVGLIGGVLFLAILKRGP